jgi:hypothetical protein
MLTETLWMKLVKADSAALDILRNGRNAKSSDGSNYISLNQITSYQEDDASGIYQSFTSGYDGRNYLDVAVHAIKGEDSFSSASVLTRSAGASLAIATIHLHMVILLNMYEAVRVCSEGGGEYRVYWDKAVAAYVGSSEGKDTSGSEVSGNLLFELAQDLCNQFGSCEDDGGSIINRNIMDLFNAGDDDCAFASDGQGKIENLLRAILVDLLAYHAKLADPNIEENHCLMAHIAKSAVLPIMFRDISDETVQVAATAIANNINAQFGECQVLDIEAVYLSLNTYVQVKGIDCAWLGSSVCSGNSTTPGSLGNENNDVYNPSPENHTLFNGYYEPITDVTSIQALSSVVNSICSADNTDMARNSYSNDATSGLTLESMSLDAKYVMSDELQFNQYIYALHDGVDVTDGSLLFDGKPATEYANTITSDALDTNIILGCQSVKVLNVWMWIVHRCKFDCFELWDYRRRCPL